jgi:hypothetical protein
MIKVSFVARDSKRETEDGPSFARGYGGRGDGDPASLKNYAVARRLVAIIRGLFF